MPKVAVIILTWNSRQHLPQCLATVTKQIYPPGHFRVVVVDNASADGSADWVAQNYPRVVLLRNQFNLGYAGGNNVGLKWAYDNGFDAAVVLNDDMKVRDTWLKELVKVAYQAPMIGLVQSKILFMQEEYRVNSVGNPLHPLGFSWSGGYKKLSSEFPNSQSIPLASGACLLIKRAVIERIGYLDERMFLYAEDVDFSWRARLAGFDIWLAAASVVWHDHHFSIGGKKFFYSERNRLLNYFAHYRLWTLLVLLPAFLLTEFLLLVYAFAGGWGWYKLKSYFSFLGMFGHLLAKRQQDKKIRLISDRELFAQLTFSLDFEEVNNILIKIFYNKIFGWYFYLAKYIVI